MEYQGERSSSLPARLSSFVGRESALRTVCQMLGDRRLVTLVGAPGVGKTRLAIEVAASLHDAEVQPVVFVPLAGLEEPDLVPERVAWALGVPAQHGRPTTDVLVEYLHARPRLLVLDNCEHLLAACAILAEAILLACPSLTVLATSREPLRIDGETTWRVPSLSMPATDTHDSAGEPIESEAIRLFIDRARAVAPDFSLTSSNGVLVAQICRRLDGIPLAIELAAARVRMLSVEQIATRLDRRFALLTGGSRTAPPRERTLRGAIDWSYGLLDEAERTLFRQLAVFAGGWTLEAVERVAAHVQDDATHESGTSPLDLLGSLVDKSLVQVEPGESLEPRYRFLESIQQYALERLRESGEEPTFRQRHLSWFADFAARCQEGTLGPTAPTWMIRHAADLDNFRSALSWSVTDPEPARVWAGLRLAGALYTFWFHRFEVAEGQRWLTRVLAADAAHRQSGAGVGPLDVAASPLGEHPRIAAMRALCVLSEDTWDRDEARQRAAETLELARVLHDPIGEAHTIVVLGNYARRYGEHQEAVRLLEQSVAMFDGLNVPNGIWRANRNLGQALLQLGEHARARQAAEASLVAARAMGWPWAIADSLRLLGVGAFQQGDLDRAFALLDESLVWWRQLGAPRGRTWALHDLGRVLLARDRIEDALAAFGETLVLCDEAGDRPGLARSLEGLASAVTRHATLVMADGVLRTVVYLLATAELLREISLSPIVPVERPAAEAAAAALRAHLGDEAFSTAWAAGRRLPRAEVVARARALSQEIARSPAQRSAQVGGEVSSVRAPLDRLTPREREVAALIGAALTNRQIAARLVITERTVEVHARNIRDRLGLETRAQMVAWALEHGLTPPHG